MGQKPCPMRASPSSSRSNACPIGSYAKGDHIFTTQAHPEFSDPFMRCVLVYTKPHLSANEVAEAEATLTRANDGPLFADWATRFFGGTP